ncbi:MULTISPECIES: hypothetical protein [Spirosoma]|uniref:Uncharacterized protein n=1 Tax=Spirosoma sordidisoli TaxID=2502893 RepID=A0A4V1RW31_9BACT|nr:MULTISPECIES: hypothetical protein [Spirosoma]RYC68848.1 hypothetical protein EQG79_15640 [Spirosoma sordidisoli]
MQPPTDRHWQTISIPASDFSERLRQLSLSQSPAGSVYSRLALIHRVASAYATEAANQAGVFPTDLQIEELTDPPLYELPPDPDPVIIQFSYQAA